MVEPTLPEILASVNDCKKQILLVAESSLHPAQFAAYRKCVLNAFGEKGLEGELKALFIKSSRERNGKGGNRLGKKGGYYDA